MKNPLVACRESLKLNVKEMGLVAGVAEQTIRWNERGENLEITPKLLNFLTDMGFDGEKLKKDYASFRDWKRKQLLRQLKEQRA